MPVIVVNAGIGQRDLRSRAQPFQGDSVHSVIHDTLILDYERPEGTA